MNQDWPKKQKISIDWEDDEVVSIEVDGVRYQDIEHILDPVDQAAVFRLLQRAAARENEPYLSDVLTSDSFTHSPLPVASGGVAVEKIVFWIFLPIALLLIALAVTFGIYTRRAIAREVSAPGEVVDLIAQESFDRDRRRVTYYFPVVEFYSADAKLHRVQLASGSSPPSHEVGEAVTVLYNPQKPLQARIQSFSSTLLMWLTPALLGFMGTIFFILAVALRLAFRTSPSPTSSFDQNGG
ncbi:DUF3592 domain-containing protein [Almyronema epifaneia]|uniref:DUF3592 domain-containing protein n=1 Tax=Almyronema epifaneia S1 TaxID=2991925 RepID=A0ABW6IA48_9CYAN